MSMVQQQQKSEEQAGLGLYVGIGLLFVGIFGALYWSMLAPTTRQWLLSFTPFG